MTWNQRIECAKPLVGAQVSPPPYFERVEQMEQKDAKGTKEQQTQEASR